MQNLDADLPRAGDEPGVEGGSDGLGGARQDGPRWQEFPAITLSP
jgi:hypothetical protein